MIILIGMLDSPYVRRTAISLECLGVPFEHKAISVFSTFEQFQKINPVVKAPTLVTDEGELIMDSSLIIQYVESKVRGKKSLWPQESLKFQHELSLVGFALAACEKSVQIVYERNLRPAEAQYEPWIKRVTGQLLAACSAIEERISKDDNSGRIAMTQANITIAVTWQFIQSMLMNIVDSSQYPFCERLANEMERTNEFKKYLPVGPGVSVQK